MNGDKGLILCGHCGVGIEPDQNFCLNCGQPVRPRGAPPTQLPVPAPGNSYLGVATRTEQSQLVESKSPNHRAIVLIVAGLLATAAVSVAITVTMLRGGSSVVRNQTGGATQSAPGPPPFKITATASSTRAPIGGGPYPPANVLDGNLRTAWVEGVAGPGIGEWIQLDFDREVQLSRVRITPGYFKSGKLWRENNRLAAATYHFSDGSARSVNFADQMETQSLEIAGMKTHWVRITIDNIYGGSADSEDTPISEITFDLSP